MRALVIGGSGFIGIHVVDALLEAGWDVAATRRKSSPTFLLRKRAVTLLQGSLEDSASLVRAMEGRDAVVLCAGYYPRYSTDLDGAVRTGVAGVERALDAAREAGVRRVVYTSSVAVLGRAPDSRPAYEADANAEGSPDDGVYARVKRAMEREVDRARERGLDVTSIVLGGCVGPWDLRVGTNGILAAILARRLPYWTDGWVNLVDVRDAARAHVAAIDAPEPRYCVGGHNVRMGWLLPHIAERYGVPLSAPRLDAAEARVRADADEREAEARRGRVGMPRELVDLVASGQPVSSTLAERQLGVAWTPLDEALDRSHDWLVRYGYVPSAERTHHAR